MKKPFLILAKNAPGQPDLVFGPFRSLEELSVPDVKTLKNPTLLFVAEPQLLELKTNNDLSKLSESKEDNRYKFLQTITLSTSVLFFLLSYTSYLEVLDGFGLTSLLISLWVIGFFALLISDLKAPVYFILPSLILAFLSPFILSLYLVLYSRFEKLLSEENESKDSIENNVRHKIEDKIEESSTGELKAV